MNWAECYECWNIRSQDYSFPGPFIPWNTFPAADHSFLRTLQTFSS